MLGDVLLAGVYGLVGLMWFFQLNIPSHPCSHPWPYWGAAPAAGLASVGLVHVAAVVGLIRGKRWGWRLQVGITALDGLLPCWTPAAVVYVRFLRRPAVRALFDGPVQEVGSEAEAPGRFRIGYGAWAVVGISFLATGSVLYVALQVPRVCTSANESVAIGSVRQVVHGESWYSERNGGYYDSLDCLAEPARCLPGGPPRPPAFVDPDRLLLRRWAGYDRTFFAGPPVQGPGGSATSIRSFAYVAVPVVFGQTGTAGFCGDATGVICCRKGAAPDLRDGLCDLTTCTPFEPAFPRERAPECS